MRKAVIVLAFVAVVDLYIRYGDEIRTFDAIISNAIDIMLFDFKSIKTTP